MPRLGLLIDLEKCYGCDSCTAACQETHLTPSDALFITVKKRGLAPDRLMAPVLCMQCDDPACLAACGADALSLDDGGIVQLDDAACTGCGGCIIDCPYGAMRAPKTVNQKLPESFMTPTQRLKLGVWIRRQRLGIPAKCDLCADRRHEGRPPACVAICPVGAIIIGDLSDPDSDISRRLQQGDPVTCRIKAASPRVFYLLPSSAVLSDLCDLIAQES